MIILFSFTINQETKEAVFSGNIEPQVALSLLQQIVVGEAIKKASQAQKEITESISKEGEDHASKTD